jgi:3-hydroxyacyl-[acyl-carrier-protein] dehydratase
MRFLLVDRIESMTPGVEVVATRRVPADDDYFADHFPGFPVVPGVLLTETMGQAAAKCLDVQRLPANKAMLVKILSASFRQWVRPGDVLTLRATISANEPRYATARCEASVDGRTVAQAELFFSFVALAQFSPGWRDAVLDDYLQRQGSP